MNGLERFLTYALAFEKTYQDDDWERIKPYFHADAIYRVDSQIAGAELIGPDAICEGIRRSLDGFDRRFESRRIEPVGRPEVFDDGCRMGWRVRYETPGVEPLDMQGVSRARFRDEKLVELVDSYATADEDAFRAWQARNPSFAVDFSYMP